MDTINDSLEVPKRQLQPDRYYTPQVHQQLKEKVHAERKFFFKYFKR